MSILLFHPGAPPFVQETARAYLQAGLLGRFHTGFRFSPDTFQGKALTRALGLLRSDARLQLSRREVPGLPSDAIRTHPLWEVVRTVSTRLFSTRLQDSIWEWTELRFDRQVARSRWDGAQAVHGYEHAALASFREAKRRGLRVIYEMPAPFHLATERILDREYQRFPELAASFSHLKERAPRRDLRRRHELELADLVICNSTFTALSIKEAGYPADNILVVPYGMPEPILEVPSEPRKDALVLLYAGTLSVRKGVHYLLQAWRELEPGPSLELRMFGAVDLPESLLRDLPGRVAIRPSLPRSLLYREYAKADLLLFPTLCDGFGMVATEALSRGLPVLTTRNAGAADFIKPRWNGFLTAPGDSGAIVEAVRWCLEHRRQLAGMKKNCLESARAWQWSDYRAALADGIGAFLADRKPPRVEFAEHSAKSELRAGP